MGIAWRELNETANDVRLPRRWVACPICGEHAWRFPPHMLDPCPLAVHAAEAQGLKFDAERMAAVRAGVHLEELGKQMREMLGYEIEDDDET